MTEKNAPTFSNSSNDYLLKPRRGNYIELFHNGSVKSSGGETSELQRIETLCNYLPTVSISMKTAVYILCDTIINDTCAYPPRLV